jgi:DNA-binding GntR family transcriptional regulator
VRPDALAADREELRTEAVHALVREAILRGELDPDEPLSQVQLAKRLGVSRTPLREALRMLQREGLVDSEPNRRVRVAPLSVADLEQVYAARIVIEALAVRLSVPLLEDGDLKALARALRELETATRARDAERWDAAHSRYHALLRRRAGARIERLAAELSDHSDRYRRVYLARPSARASAAAEHVAIYDACRERDASAASSRLAQHLARTALTVIADAAPDHDPAPVRTALRLVAPPAA